LTCTDMGAGHTGGQAINPFDLVFWQKLAGVLIK